MNSHALIGGEAGEPRRRRGDCANEAGVGGGGGGACEGCRRGERGMGRMDDSINRNALTVHNRVL